MNVFRRIPWRFYGVWMLPLLGMMGVALHGTSTYGWPVLFPVITKEFGWSAAVAATASSLARFEGGFESIIFGWVMDKYGPRVTYYIGGLCLGLGWLALSLINKDGLFWYFIIFGVIVQTGANVGGYASGYKAVNSWWIRWRARGTAAFVLPVGLAGTFSPMIVASLVRSNGFRFALLAMGIFVLVIFLPAAYFIRPHKPEYYGLLPDGDDPKQVQAVLNEEDKAAINKALAEAAAKKQTDYTTKEAMKTNAFWVYTIASIFYNFAFMGVTLFVPAHLMSRGYDLTTAAFFAGLMLSFSYVGRFIVFFFGDVISPKWMSIGCWIVGGLGIVSLANATPQMSILAWGYSIVYGSAYGVTFTIVPVVRGWLFGRSSFGTISGIQTTITMIGSITVPIVQGWTYDTYGSYWLGYMLVAASYFVAAAIFVFAKRPAPKPVQVLEPTVA